MFRIQVQALLREVRGDGICSNKGASPSNIYGLLPYVTIYVWFHHYKGLFNLVFSTVDWTVMVNLFRTLDNHLCPSIEENNFACVYFQDKEPSKQTLFLH